MSRYQKTYEAIRARVRAGEGKRSIFDDYAARGGREASLAPRILCQIATNRNRRRFLWAHVALLSAFSLYAIFHFAGLVLYILLDLPAACPGVSPLQAARAPVASCVALLIAIRLCAGRNPAGYLMSAAIACLRLCDFLGARTLSPAIAVQCVLLAVTLAAGVVLHCGMFPCTSFFLRPRRDTHGVPEFED